jgi:hypothetical protein
MNHRSGPIQRTDEIDCPGGQPERERAQRRLSWKVTRTAAPPGKRDEQGDERYPGERRMAVTGETESQQPTGQKGEQVVR